MPIPEDLDLDSWIYDPPSDSSESDEMDMNEIFIKTEKPVHHVKSNSTEPSLDDIQKMRDARKLELQNNPNYLKGTSIVKDSSSYYNLSNNNDDDFDNIPVAELNIPVSLKVPGFDHNDYSKKGAKRSKRHGKKKSRKSWLHQTTK